MSKTYATFDKMKPTCVEYHDDILPPELHKRAFKEITEKIEFMTPEESAIMMAGKKVFVPRKQQGYGDVHTYYRFTGVKVNAKNWEDCPMLKEIRDYLEEKTGWPFNFVLVNLYEHGEKYIGWHSDDEEDLDKKAPIASMTLGAERDFMFRHKVTGQTFCQVLKDNSLALMKFPCQRLFKHHLPVRKKVKTPRLNLTFRVMTTGSAPSTQV